MADTRIGLVGYCTPSGIGVVNQQIACFGRVNHWLVTLHSNLPNQDPSGYLNQDEAKWNYYDGHQPSLAKFLEGVDVVVFAETPGKIPDLVHWARRLEKRVVCVPMQEWTPIGTWLPLVHTLICPTKQCYDELSLFHPNAKLFPWPVDTARFQHRTRYNANKFLFINGHGGWRGRKGGHVVKEAAKLVPRVKVLVRSQIHDTWPNMTKLSGPVANQWELYTEGDVLIAPHSVDGIGLELHEAMASGIPVIATDGKPWDEVPCIDRIRAHKERRRVARSVDWYLPDPNDLAVLLHKWNNKDIERYSIDCREWTERMDWRVWAPRFRELLCHS